jgi:cytochrome c oxidase subunit IV
MFSQPGGLAPVIKREVLAGRSHAKLYPFVYISLILLLGTAIGMSFLHLGAAKVFLILGTAVLQILIILLFFMHLRLESRLIWIFAGGCLIWLGIFFALAFSDYFTRGLNWLR